MLRKLGLVFLGLVISFVLATQVGSGEPLGEGHRREGEIVFRTENENKQAKVKVAISAPMAKEEKAYKAWIVVEYKDSYLKVEAFCFNNTSEDEVLRYRLEAKKSGESGTAHTCQSGSVCIPSQEKKCLSKLTLGVSPKDHYQIKLEVYKDEKLVAKDSIFYPSILEACRPPGIASLFSLARIIWTCEAKTSFICRLLCKSTPLTPFS